MGDSDLVEFGADVVIEKVDDREASRWREVSAGAEARGKGKANVHQGDDEPEARHNMRLQDSSE